MTPSRGRRRHFEEFREHTRLKHAILSAYVQEWAAKLLHWGGAGNTVWFVDAFAGAGRDNPGNPGSPLIVGRVAQDIRTGRMTVPHDRVVRLRMLAIEESTARFRKLERALTAEFGEGHPDITVRKGTLTEYIDPFLKFVRRAPVLYFLDPFGLAGIEVSLLPKMLAAPQAEVLALVSDIGALRLYALTQAHTPDFTDAIARAHATVSLFGEDFSAEDLRAELARITRRERGYANRPSAEEILTRSLGAEWRTEFAGLRFDQIPGRAVALYVRKLRQAGATFVTPFSVCDAHGHHKYFLVHATKSAAGVEAFKESIARAVGQMVLGAASLALETDVDGAVRVIERHFAGRDVPWTGNGDTVRRFALSQTPLFPNDLDGVKRTLTERGYRQPGRSITYRFPEAPPER